MEWIGGEFVVADEPLDLADEEIGAKPIDPGGVRLLARVECVA